MTSTDTTEEKTFAEGWRANVFSLTAWRRHLIWFVAAAAAGGVALYFNYAERWSRVSLHFLMTSPRSCPPCSSPAG